jgi:hypothetical protein
MLALNFPCFFKTDTIRHAAASYGHKELITYLLENGANVNIQDPEGDSPLFVCETVDIAEMLVKAGADAKHINENEMTVSHHTFCDLPRFTVAFLLRASELTSHFYSHLIGC